MSEVSLSPNTTTSPSPSPKEKKKTESMSVSRLISDFHLLCSFLLSHPLYFSYLLFFSPYILRVFSFLSPLFLTTSLLLLILLTNLIHRNSGIGCYEDDEFRQFEQLDAYKIVFETTENVEIDGDDSAQVAEPTETLKEITDIANFEKVVEEEEAAMVDKYSILESFSSNSRLVGEEEEERLLVKKENDNDFVDVLCCEKVEKEVKPLSEESDKVEIQQEKEVEEEKSAMKTGSDAVESKTAINEEEVLRNLNKARSYSCREIFNNKKTREDPNLGGFGSMRKEKEWKRTLACKLFEERHNSNSNNNINAEGGEGMDLLWETYETELSNKTVVKEKKGKKKAYNKEDEDEDDDDEMDYDDNGKLCCLQALKFSAGKMNLGMGRPNLVKISKAIKGIGWLHNVGKHAKKVVHH